MWYIKIIAFILLWFCSWTFVCWLSDKFEQHTKQNEAIRAENKLLKAKLDTANDIISKQNGVIRALEYTSRYPLFTAPDKPRTRKGASLMVEYHFNAK